MKSFLFVLMTLSLTAFSEDKFLSEAPVLATTLKTSLMQELQVKIAKVGTVEAVPFCHANVKSIAKTAAKAYLSKYEFGRTSHKTRNENNKPAPWMNEYLQKFKTLKMGSTDAKAFVHTLPEGTRVFMEPLFIQPMCLSCHGEKINPDVKAKVSSLYPKDQATGFKLGEFRGFIWVKEKK